MEKKSILTIDDDEVQLKVFDNVLSQKYTVHAVKSASNALNFLNANQVDAILLDISMPNISGFEFLSDIRKIPSYFKVPIIIVSGNTGQDFFAEARASTAFDVLTKPVEPEKLISTIENAFSEENAHS